MRKALERVPVVLLASMLALPGGAAEQAPPPDDPQALQRPAPTKIRPAVSGPKAPARLAPALPYRIYTGKDYFDLLLSRQCTGKPAVCWLEETNTQGNLLFPGKTLTAFENISAQNSLWFPFPQSAIQQAPSPSAGVVVAPGGQLVATLLGYTSTMPMSAPITVVAVLLCPQGGQPAVCAQVQPTWLRIHFQ